jgi:Flp pilus assembly pilin Flp
MSESLAGTDPDVLAAVGEDTEVQTGSGEEGVTTAEYAMGVVMVITFITIVILALRQGWLGALVQALVKAIFGLITQQLGAAIAV